MLNSRQILLLGAPIPYKVYWAKQMTQVTAQVVSMWSSLQPPDREALRAGVSEIHPLQGLAFFIDLKPPLWEENDSKTDA